MQPTGSMLESRFGTVATGPGGGSPGMPGGRSRAGLPDFGSELGAAIGRAPERSGTVSGNGRSADAPLRRGVVEAEARQRGGRADPVLDRVPIRLADQIPAQPPVETPGTAAERAGPGTPAGPGSALPGVAGASANREAGEAGATGLGGRDPAGGPRRVGAVGEDVAGARTHGPAARETRLAAGAVEAQPVGPASRLRAEAVAGVADVPIPGSPISGDVLAGSRAEGLPGAVAEVPSRSAARPSVPSPLAPSAMVLSRDAGTGSNGAAAPSPPVGPFASSRAAGGSDSEAPSSASRLPAPTPDGGARSDAVSSFAASTTATLAERAAGSPEADPLSGQAPPRTVEANAAAANVDRASGAGSGGGGGVPGGPAKGSGPSSVSSGAGGPRPAASAPAGQISSPATRHDAPSPVPGTGSAETGGRGGATSAGSSSVGVSVKDAFVRMDAGDAPSAHWLRSAPRMVEVGVDDPSHGWLEIRAQGGAGQVAASLSAASPEAHSALHAQLSGMAEYLADRAIGVRSLAVGEPASAGSAAGFSDRGGSGPGQGSNQGADQNMNQNTNENMSQDMNRGASRSTRQSADPESAEGRRPPASGLAAQPAGGAFGPARRISVRV